jgi:hypothetical protein
MFSGTLGQHLVQGGARVLQPYNSYYYNSYYYNSAHSLAGGQ